MQPPYTQYLDSTLNALQALRELGEIPPMATRQVLGRLQTAQPPAKSEASGPSVVFINPAEGNDPPTNDALSTLLKNILKAMKLGQDEVGILASEPEGGWAPWARNTSPEVIVCLGPEALASTGLPLVEPGGWIDLHGTPVIVTLALTQIHNTGELTMKRQLWEHMLQVLHRLDHPITQAQRNYFK